MISKAVADAQEALRQLLLQQAEPTTVWVGFSGGVDSTALLWLASKLVPQVFPRAELRAIHINHNLQSESGRWAQHCSRVAEQLDIKIEVVSVAPDSKSEESARIARYQAFENAMSRGDLCFWPTSAMIRPKRC